MLQDSWTPLVVALVRLNIAVAQALLDHRPDVDIQDCVRLNTQLCSLLYCHADNNILGYMYTIRKNECLLCVLCVCMYIQSVCVSNRLFTSCRMV